MHLLAFLAVSAVLVAARPKMKASDRKLLSDIPCPSGGKMYVDPKTSDIEMCTQHFGFYANTCPNGTRCERLANRNLLFKDFCCWPPVDMQTTTMMTTTTETSEEPITTASVDEVITTSASVDIPTEEKGEEAEEKEAEEKEAEEEVTEVGEVTEVSEVDEIEELLAKKFTAPRCKNKRDKVLIDLGNRIGNRIPDCSYSPCPKGYNCEFNDDVRQFICCGIPPDDLPAVGFPLEPITKIRVIEPQPKKKPGRKWKYCPDGRALMYFEEIYPVACEQDGKEKGKCPYTHAACLPSKEHEHKVCCDIRNFQTSEEAVLFKIGS